MCDTCEEKQNEQQCTHLNFWVNWIQYFEAIIIQARRSSCISRLPSAAPILPPTSPASIIEEK